MEIAKHTWDGHDYLPYFFDSWLKDLNSHTAAIEHDGHVIALANLRVIEDGKTGWMEGLRVHPEHRGKGLASDLTRHIVHIAKNIPVERIRYTTAAGNEMSLHLGASIGMERKLDLAILWQEFSEEISWHSSNQPIQEANPTEMYPDLIHAGVVPHNVIMYDWKALDVSLEGLQKIALLSKFWIQRQDDVINSFSLGFVNQDKTGPQWSFTIYAKDKLGFLDQFSHHVSMALETNCKTLFAAYQLDFVDTLYALDWVTPHEDEEMALTLLERML